MIKDIWELLKAIVLVIAAGLFLVTVFVFFFAITFAPVAGAWWLITAVFHITFRWSVPLCLYIGAAIALNIK